MESKVEEYITFLRSEIKERSQCMMFAMLLKLKFSSAQILYNNHHFITEIDGECYDWDGLTERTKRFLCFPEGYGDHHIVNHYRAIEERFIKNSKS